MAEQQAPDPVPRVVDHVGFAVADYKRSKAFYERALAPLVTYLIGWGYDGWDGTKVLWTVPRYNGPYIVRGRQLDGTGELRFDQGPTWTNKLHEELRLVGPYGLLNPAATFLRAPGCYAYQVDGRGFSYLIVFEAQPN